MKTLRKLIFLSILINLITFNSCESDDLYEKFLNKERKAIEDFEKYFAESKNENSENPIKKRRNLALSEDEFNDNDEMEEDEHFRSLFNHMRAYRDKNQISGDGESEGNKNGKFS